MTRLPSRSAVVLTALTVLGAVTLVAQRPAAAPTAVASPSPATLLKRIEWRSVGPANNAGRISVVTGGSDL